MTLLMIGLGGLAVLVWFGCAFEGAWRRSNPAVLARVVGRDEPEDAERAATAALLAGRMSRGDYRDLAGSLAAAEPQPTELQQLT